MPKRRRDRSLSFDRSNLSPFPCTSLGKDPLENDNNNNIKEWEDARCAVCMEHPHNAILLICSSHEKGCRPFMCDTSYRHSNCFDQFRKSFDKEESPETAQSQHTPVEIPIPNPNPNQIPTIIIPEESEQEVSNIVKPKNLVCPLCRGAINGWTVVESARFFMNEKTRSCASEECDFNGSYSDLRKHARSVHPFVRPTDADPERQRNWRRLERQRDLGDLLSTLESSIGIGELDERSSIISEDNENENERSTTLSLDDDSGWLTVFFLVRFIRPGNVNGNGNDNSGTSATSGGGTSRGQVAVRRRSMRRLWGETYDNGVIHTTSSSRDDDNASSDGGQPRTRRYVRRRFRNQQPEDE